MGNKILDYPNWEKKKKKTNRLTCRKLTKHKESCTPLTYIYESVIMSIIALIYQCYPQTSPYFPKPPDTPPLNMAQNTFYGSNIRCSQTERFTTGISPVTFDGGTESKVKV